MESWTANDEFVGSTFADYWDTPASFDELSVKEIPEDSTCVAIIKTDAVHIIDPVPFSFLPGLLEADFSRTVTIRAARPKQSPTAATSGCSSILKETTGIATVSL